jgi:proteasome lid subunit RPN8/RPN11
MDIIESANKPLIHSMLAAAKACDHRVEEEGGIILSKEGEYVFVKVKNIHEGTSTASGLYETDQQELKDNVFSKVSAGWKLHASFHTHPAFSPNPSSLDINKLFLGFKYNIIFAPISNMFSYSQWEGNRSLMYYMPAYTLENLVKN